MASVFKHLVEHIEKIGIKHPVEIPHDLAVRRVVEKALPKHILEAFSAGIKPTLSDWLEMPEIEQMYWQKFYEEKERSDKILLSVIQGNSVVAKTLLHIEDEKALRNDAIELGLQKVRL